MELTELLGLILHIDKALGLMLEQYGALVYVLLFAIVFAETGLVVFPFLPGDTLLFIAGAFCASGLMSAPLLMALLITAAITGNTLNYLIGRALGQRVFTRDYRWIDRQALEKTHAFFERHGGKTIILARWLPVIRTFAPFVAGVSDMGLGRFQIFNIVGALLWVIGLVMAGYFFGNIPIIRDHLNTIVLIGVAAAAGPVALAAIIRFVRSRTQRQPNEH
ncbi:MAG: VTT domain-containing protein [Burkholderiales bacterium]|jgi:membrane-associated protein|nr:VTT domain-containing protein [Burkholderiales bacterium]